MLAHEGFSFLSRLHTHTHTDSNDIPVVVLSARDISRSCPSMRWKFGVELERPSVRRPEVELL